VVALARGFLPRSRRAALAAGAALALLGLWPQVDYFWRNRPGPSAHVATYQLVSDWLSANTPPDSSVALLEIGVIGYETERPVVDLMGLVTPSMIGHLHGWDQAFYYAVTHNWPDYVVALQGMAWTTAPLPEPLARIYTPAARIENPADGTAPILIFQRRPDFPPRQFAAEWPQGLLYDQLFTLERIQAGSATLTPGQELPLRLSWSVNQDVTADYQFAIDSVDLSDGRRVELRPLSQPVYGGAPTAHWRAGSQYVEDLLLNIPADLAPGAYRLVLRAARAGVAVEPAAVTTGQTTPAMSGVLTTPALAAVPAYDPAPVSFGPDLRLLGRQVAAAGDNQLQLTLFWAAANPVAGAATVFVHVLDAGQQLLGQDDTPPAGGALPVALWGPGVTVTDAHLLTLTAPLTPGAQICVGLYDSVTLARFEVQPAAGYDVHDNEACWTLAAP
jgi:hypothetical protein